MQDPEHLQRPKIWQGLASYWHHDNPTEGTKVTGQNTGRVIGYVMQDGACGRGTGFADTAREREWPEQGSHTDQDSDEMSLRNALVQPTRNGMRTMSRRARAHCAHPQETSYQVAAAAGLAGI